MTKIRYTGSTPDRCRDAMPRRRARRTKTHRGATPFLQGRRLVLGGLILAAVVLASATGLYSLRVGRVHVVGAVVADTAQLEATLSQCFGQRLFLLDRDELERTILADPWIREVRLIPWIDGSLRVRITEACPVFVLVGGDAVCADGSILPIRPGLDLTDLPRLEAPRCTEGGPLTEGATEAVRRFCGALARTPWTWPLGLRSVRLEDDGDIALVTGRGVEVALGREAWGRRLAAFTAALPVLSPDPGARVDLRFERQVIVAPAASRLVEG